MMNICVQCTYDDTYDDTRHIEKVQSTRQSSLNQTGSPRRRKGRGRGRRRRESREWNTCSKAKTLGRVTTQACNCKPNKKKRKREKKTRKKSRGWNACSSTKESCKSGSTGLQLNVNNNIKLIVAGD
jgi:hypothetical protein